MATKLGTFIRKVGGAVKKTVQKLSTNAAAGQAANQARMASQTAKIQQQLAPVKQKVGGAIKSAFQTIAKPPVSARFGQSGAPGTPGAVSYAQHQAPKKAGVKQDIAAHLSKNTQKNKK